MRDALAENGDEELESEELNEKQVILIFLFLMFANESTYE